MTAALAAVQSEDLGGGFRFTRQAAGGAVIVADALTPLGFHGLMSPASVNARVREEFHVWANAVLPGAGSRLRGVDQVHGAHVVHAEPLRDGRRVEADGVIAASAQDAPVVMAADCAPVWLVDPGHRVVALLHAGWRGIAAGVIEAGVRACAERGANAHQLVAAIGPHLQMCCFEVGPEVAIQFPGHTRPAAALVVERQRDDSVALDAASAIAARLSSQGVRTIHFALACTRCRGDILHSYRRNGKGGPLMGALGMHADFGAP
jgi:YfiH family protein